MEGTGHDVDRTREELGEALAELRQGLDEVLADARRRLDERDHTPVDASTAITPDAGGAVWELVRRLPGVIGHSLSGDEARVATARGTLADLDGRLREAGVDLDDRFTGFADRLAGLREELRRDG